jgi:hypothetical protein
MTRTGYAKAEIDPAALKILLDDIKAEKIKPQPSNYVIMTTLRTAGIPIEHGPAGCYRKAIKDKLGMIK